jgi:hypothetical protein
MMDYEKKWEKVLICVGRLREGRMGNLPSSIFLGGNSVFLEIVARPRSFLVNCVFVSLSNRDETRSFQLRQVSEVSE